MRHRPCTGIGVAHPRRADLGALVEALVRAHVDVTIRVLDLPTLIRIKHATGRARDKLLLPILIALSEEKKGSGA